MQAQFISKVSSKRTGLVEVGKRSTGVMSLVLRTYVQFGGWGGDRYNVKRWELLIDWWVSIMLTVNAFPWNM